MGILGNYGKTRELWDTIITINTGRYEKDSHSAVNRSRANMESGEDIPYYSDEVPCSSPKMDFVEENDDDDDASFCSCSLYSDFLDEDSDADIYEEAIPNSCPLFSSDESGDETVPNSCPLFSSDESGDETIPNSCPLFSSDESGDETIPNSCPLFSSDESGDETIPNSCPLFSSDESGDETIPNSCPLYSVDQNGDDFPDEEQDQSGYGIENFYSLTNRVDRMIRKFNVAGVEFQLRIEMNQLNFMQALERLHAVLEREYKSYISFLDKLP